MRVVFMLKLLTNLGKFQSKYYRQIIVPLKQDTIPRLLNYWVHYFYLNLCFQLETL